MTVTRIPNYVMSNPTGDEAAFSSKAPISPFTNIMHPDTSQTQKVLATPTTTTKMSPKRHLSLPVVSPPHTKRQNGTTTSNPRQYEPKLIETARFIRLCSFIQFIFLASHGVFLMTSLEILMGLGYILLGMGVLFVAFWIKKASSTLMAATQSSIDGIYAAVTTQFGISICTTVLGVVSVVLWSSSLVIASLYSIDNVTLAEDPIDDDHYINQLKELLRLSIPFATINLMLTSFELVLSVMNLVATYKYRQLLKQWIIARHSSSTFLVSPDSILSFDNKTISANSNKEFHSQNTAASSTLLSSSSSSSYHVQPGSPDSSIRDANTGHRYDELYDETTPSPTDNGFVHI